MSPFRHPVVAVSHGPGPLWLLEDAFFGVNKHAISAQNVRAIFSTVYPSEDAPLPKRILIVSAHWESDSSSAFEISQTAEPELIFDYYGLPAPAYDVTYAAKGDPAFAKRVAEALSQCKIPNKLVERGLDHGAFVPLSLIRPAADIPIVSVSINDRLGAAAHFELGQALAPLRDEDTLIVCSGHATHNMRANRNPAPVSEWAQGFQDWLDSVCTSASALTFAERKAALSDWERAAPFAKLAHPSADHFSPFVIAAGAGMDERQPHGEKIIDGWYMGQFSLASYAWGIAK